MITESKTRKGLSLVIPVIISLVLLVTLVILPAQAADPPQPQPAPVRPPPDQPPPVIDGHGTGFIPPPMDLSHLTGQEMPEGLMGLGIPPPSFDWRTMSKVTPVKNQGTCGSCYAFAALANYESRNRIVGAWPPHLPDYSENNAKECNWRERNGYTGVGGWGSCDGGNAYMMASLWSQAGVVTEDYDPYTQNDVSCFCFDYCPYAQTLLGWSIISGQAIPDTNVLKSHIYNYGPVYTGIYVGCDGNTAWRTEFGNYDGSYPLLYPSCPYAPNHAVCIVGWDDSITYTGGNGVWIVKNSWDTGWGDSGYFYIAYQSANIGWYSSYMYHWQWYNPYGGIMYYDDDCWSGAHMDTAARPPGPCANTTRLMIPALPAWNSGPRTRRPMSMYTSTITSTERLSAASCGRASTTASPKPATTVSRFTRLCR